MIAKFEMQKTRVGPFIFVLKTAKGRILLTGEPHRCCSGAVGVVGSVRQNANGAEWFERRQAATGQFYFIRTTAKGRVLGCGPIQLSRRIIERDIHSVLTHGLAADIVDTGES